MYNPVHVNRCEALGNRIVDASTMEVSPVLRIQFVFIVFCNIPNY